MRAETLHIVHVVVPQNAPYMCAFKVRTGLRLSSLILIEGQPKSTLKSYSGKIWKCGGLSKTGQSEDSEIQRACQRQKTTLLYHQPRQPPATTESGVAGQPLGRGRAVRAVCPVAAGKRKRTPAAVATRRDLDKRLEALDD